MLSTIIMATIVPALCSALVIFMIPHSILGRMGKALSLIATGLLLTLALTHLLPEAIEEGHDIHDIGLTIWLTIMVLIAIEMFFNSNHNAPTCPVCTSTHHSSTCPVCQNGAPHVHSANQDHTNSTIINISRPINLSLMSVHPAPTHEHSHDHGSCQELGHDHSNCHDHEHGHEHPDNRSTLHHLGHSHLFSLKASDIEQAHKKAKENESLGTGSIKRGIANGGAPILAGSIFHSLCDGIVIASSFMVDFQVGIAITAAIIAHEMPQQISNYILMLNFGMSRLQGYIVNLVALLGSLIGGILFYNILDKAHSILPFALAVAGGSFIYVALSDILPRINKPDNKRRMIISFGYLFLGAILAMFLSHHH